ncbi:MAG: cytochrome c [bacterium]
MAQGWIQTFYGFLNALGYTHALHAALAHAPIGLTIGAFLLGAAALAFRWSRASISARHCAGLALLFVLPTVLLGYMDWQHFYHGAWVFPIKAKIVLASLLLVLLFLGFLISYKAQRQTFAALVFFLLAFSAVIGLGYFGGELVFGGKGGHAPISVAYQAGETLYASNCSACHPGGRNTFAPNQPVIGSWRNRDFETFLAWIRAPAPPMPAFGPVEMTDEQVRQLYGYIRNVLEKQNQPNG